MFFLILFLFFHKYFNHLFCFATIYFTFEYLYNILFIFNPHFFFSRYMAIHFSFTFLKFSQMLNLKCVIPSVVLKKGSPSGLMLSETVCIEKSA